MRIRFSEKTFFFLLLFSGMVRSALSQENLIFNGTFNNKEGWNTLGQYDGGVATGIFDDNAYFIDISEPGNQSWSIQFTQNHITLEKGKYYILSYTLSCTESRTVEVGLSRNGGDYISYSGLDTVAVTTSPQKFNNGFLMEHETDTDVRLEFNCGKAGGKIAIRNVSLVSDTTPHLHLTSPRPDDRFNSDTPSFITWRSINISDSIIIELSTDNGSTWNTIDTVAASTGSYEWTPHRNYSAWCRIRISSIGDQIVSSETEIPFEITPRHELVIAGSFDDSEDYNVWKFNLSGGDARGAVTPEARYQVSINTGGEEHWQIQLSQIGIPLEVDQLYTFRFTAYASAETEMQISVGMDHEPYTSYLDTTKWIIALSEQPVDYSFTVQTPGVNDSSSRVEFNFGKSSGTITIDDVSLVPQYVAPVFSSSFHPRGSLDQTKQVVSLNKPLIFLRTKQLYGTTTVDLRGRILSIENITRLPCKNRFSSGMYITGLPLK